MNGVDLLIDDVRISEALPLEVAAEVAIRLSFNTESGKIYQLEAADSLKFPSWKQVGEKITGNGGVMDIYRSAVDPEMRIFRLVLAASGSGTDCVQSASSQFSSN